MLINVAESMSVHKPVYACMHPDRGHIVSGLVLQRHSEWKVQRVNINMSTQSMS